MTYEQFWQSSFEDMALRGEAYLRNNRSSGMYFREMYALLYNINRSEKAPVLEGKDVLTIHGEKPLRKQRERKTDSGIPGWTLAELQSVNERINAAAKRDTYDGALFKLGEHDYLREREKGKITDGMVEKARAMADKVTIVSDNLLDKIAAETGYIRPGHLPTPSQIQSGFHKPTPPIVPSADVSQSVVGESTQEPEPESRADANSFVPPGLIGEAIPIQPSE